jgi:Tfp pilus assembly protein PilN
MSTTTPTGVRTAILPKVNLLPTEISEGARFRNLQAALAMLIVLAVLVVGALTYLANGQVSDAQDGLNAAQSHGAQLEAETAAYANVPQQYALVATADAQLEQAMSQEIRYSFVLNDLSLRMPAGVWLTNVSIAQPVDTPNQTKGAWGTPVLATVKFTGTAITLNDVAGWLDALAKGGNYTDPYLGQANTASTTTTTSTTPGTAPMWSFDSSMGITTKALSNRYTQKAGS